ncbi:MAG TPA: hypothetical protein DGH68_10540, partial [Bacteroidetes bacterium]|nr:hypothetical protein [Bacteroidota bacterium]
DERLMSTLGKNHAANAETIRDIVVSEVKKFAGTATQHDDQTIVVVKVRAEQSSISKG